MLEIRKCIAHSVTTWDSLKTVLIPTMKTLNDGKKNDAGITAANTDTKPENIDFSKVKIEPLFEETVDFETFSKSDCGKG